MQGSMLEAEGLVGAKALSRREAGPPEDQNQGLCGQSLVMEGDGK